MLLLLNAHYAKQDEKLDLLHEREHEIVDVVSINFRSLQSKLEGRYQRENSWRRSERVDAERRHAETIAAIFTTRDGNSRTIKGTHCSVNIAPHSISDLGSCRKSDLDLHSACSVTRYSEKESPDFFLTDLPESFLDKLLAMPEARTDAHDTNIGASKAHLASGAGNPEATALTLLLPLMLRVTEIRASSEELSKEFSKIALALTDVGPSRDASPGKARGLEGLRKSKNAALWARDLPQPRSIPGNPQEPKKSKVVSQIYSEQPANANTRSAAQHTQSNRANLANGMTEYGKVDDPKIFFGVKSRPLAWTNQKPRSQPAPRMERVEIDLKAPAFHLRNEQELMSRGCRLERLDLDEQQVAIELGRGNLTIRDERSMYSWISRCSVQKQAQIIQCAELVWEKQQTSLKNKHRGEDLRKHPSPKHTSGRPPILHLHSRNYTRLYLLEPITPASGNLGLASFSARSRDFQPPGTRAGGIISRVKSKADQS